MIQKIISNINVPNLIVGIFLGALILYIIFLVISKGRLHYIFTEYRYKCGVIKILGDNPDITSFYNSAYDAGAHMHGCVKKNYRYNGLDYKLASDGKYYANL